MDSVALVRRYYDALDDHDYAALEEILSTEFFQRRPDRTFEDRDAFVRFMREKRPNPETSHELISIVANGGAEHSNGDGSSDVAARGRVLDGGVGPDGESAVDSGRELFEFADFFELDLENGRIVRLETYSR
ncbi:nuclear transport factor 2 family protein [Halobiforma nitratireducens]|uniref:SnoaL-like domain-containing protein n=1 Tax=Halobiforma nitratireducens JCM 10879 TaxID=1227454 RepID=M0LK20_9EURY|nr:nuclear transport factor 2 family protein [Halobiforma nitratireducens]EMA33403.1 hypothetical protein C446_14274 [Halobiforma nitratireducens JCM 10879]